MNKSQDNKLIRNSTALIVGVLLSISGVIAQVQVKGVVLDEERIPVIGASVMVKGTSTGTITNINGEFNITAKKNSTLIISYIGYSTVEVEVKEQETLTVHMRQITQNLDEIVVVGFGSQRKESVVGAISQVRGDDLMKAGVPNISNSLAGRIPGLITIQQSGLPGSNDATIYIRGMSSFTGSNSPLVLVDNVERSMSNIDPSEVESISVLKDASATAVFGVKGANGVILITTKRGQEGKMEISAKFDQTFKVPIIENFTLGSYETLIGRNKIYRNNNNFGSVLSDEILEHYRLQDMPYIYPDVNILDLMLRDFGTDSQASITARGGTKNSKYFVSLGYLHEGDVFEASQPLFDPSTSFERFNFRMNFDFNLSKTTHISVSSGGFLGIDSSSPYQRAFREITFTPPYDSPVVYPASILELYPDPNWPEIKDREAGSLLSPGSYTAYYNYNSRDFVKNQRTSLGSDFNLVQKLDFVTKGLSFKANLSYNTQSYYTGDGIAYNGDYFTLNLLANGRHEWKRYVGRSEDYFSVMLPPFYSSTSRMSKPLPARVIEYGGQLDYNRKFNLHNVTGLALFKRREVYSGANFPRYEENWVGRVTYDYNRKYMIESNLGISGSEQFAPKNRFGVFPALAVGWNVANEDFIKNNIKSINNLKLRYSYGESGSDNTGSQWLYISEYTNWQSYNTGVVGTSKNVTTLKEGKVPNDQARWERSRKHNLGLEFGLNENEYTFTAELYNEFRDGILMDRRSVASWFGQEILPLNIGATKNHGYEFEIGYNKMFHKDFHFWTKANFNFNENRIVNRDDPKLIPDYLKLEGVPIGQNKSNINIGYYQDMDEMMNYSLNNNNRSTIGSDMILDFNGDAVINVNDEVYIGRTTVPNYTFSFSSGVSYKNFDFNFMLQGVAGVDRQYSGYYNPMFTTLIGHIMFKDKEDVWSPDNRDAEHANWGTWNNGQKSMIDAYYFRLKSVEFGYDIPKKLVKGLGFSSGRLYFQGFNLLTYAPNITIGDPESLRSTNAYGTVDYTDFVDSYPLPRRYTLGIKMSF